MMRAVRREARIRREARRGAPGFGPAGVKFARVARAKHRGAFSMLELMVAIAIIVALVSLVVVGARAAHNYSRKSNAQQQIKLIANAIDAYSTFWTRWSVGSVVIAEKGWPDFIPGRLFATIANGGVYLPDTSPEAINADVNYDNEENITYDPQSGVMTFGEGAPDQANECLAYGLTSASGKGPYIKDEMKGGLMKVESDSYPAQGGAPAPSRVTFVDPWGNLYRYFWVYRDPNGPQGGSKGLLPVDYGAYRAGGGFGGVENPQFKYIVNGQPKYKTAIGFVLESAGPDGKFGNVWKATPPTQKEIEDAADNLMITP